MTAILSLSVTGCRQSAINPTGAWEVTVSSTNTQINYDSGPTVNGKAPVSEMPITEAKLQGTEISFNFTHPPAAGNGPGATYSYRGTISGDSISGTFTTQWMGETRTKEWKANRLKE
jgi:hypothetical protein